MDQLYFGYHAVLCGVANKDSRVVIINLHVMGICHVMYHVIISCGFNGKLLGAMN